MVKMGRMRLHLLGFLPETSERTLRAQWEDELDLLALLDRVEVRLWVYEL
jgi:hypothetical protein